ncbi:DUF1573 domain-containing protein [Rubripirellula amarantea]|nr:DUF1573 domain-containing protein [Rubripirellula amarantea]
MNNELVKFTKLYRVCVCSISVLLSLFSPNAFAEEKMPATKVSLGPKDIQLDQQGRSLWYSKIKLGKVEMGKTLSVSCRITNESTNDVVVAGVESSCTCTKVTIDQADWFSGDDIIVKAEIDVPATAKSAVFTSTVTVALASEDELAPSVNMHLNFLMEIGNLLSFSSTFIPVAIRDGKSPKIEIPLVCSVEMPDLALTCENKEIESASTLLRTGEKWMVVVDLPPHKEGDQDSRSLIGEIAVRESKTGLSTKAVLSVTRLSLVSISPALARFEPELEDEDHFIVSAICRVRKPNEDGISTDKIAVTLSLDGKSTPVHVTNLGNGVARMKARVNKEQILDEDGDIPSSKKSLNWTVWAGKDSWSVTTNAVYPSHVRK